MRVNPTLLLLALIVTFIPFMTSDSDGAVELDMVCPTGTEGFTLINIGPYDTDLEGWIVSDGEGKITFTESLVLQSGEEITLMSQTPESWMQLTSYILYGQSGTVCDRFSLNDKGDELYVIDGNGNTVYSFCYGESTDPDPFQKIPKGHVALRNHAFGYPGETEKWILHVPGRTLYHFQRTYEDCEVIPISFPESDGSEILAHIQGAENSIRISMYTFDNKDIASALRYALEKGVMVMILMEGQPAGGIDSDEIRVLTTLWKSGADIKMIHTQDSYKRYQYVHSKYAIIDDDVSIITSENWTDSAFSGNRGWGTVIRDEGCARYLIQIFDSDFTDKGDLSDFRERYPTSIPYVLQPYSPKEYQLDSYIANVTPVVCPDYSSKSLKEYIQSAQYRIYSQQLNVQYSWTEGADNPLQWMREAGSKGVDSRLLVDVTYESPYDDESKDGYGLYTMYQYDECIQLRYFIPTVSGLMHNKGVIVDDSVWIGSMNWTDNSISSNREMSVIVHSKEIADLYASLFLHDWGMEFTRTVEICLETSDVTFGEYVTLDASKSSAPFGSIFEWNLDDDSDIERTGTTVEWRFYRDTVCTIRVVDPDGNVYSKEFRISSEGVDSKSDGDGDFDLPGPVRYVPLAILIAGIVILRRLHPGK